MCYIIHLQTNQTAIFKTLVEITNSLLSDVNFIFYPKSDSDFIILKEVNKTGKVLVQIKIDVNKLNKYQYNYKKNKFIMGVDINNLNKCLKCVSNFDIIELKIDEDDINRLIIVLESIENKVKKTFRINLIDIDEDMYDIAPIEYPYVVSLSSQHLYKYCKDMSFITDKIEIKVTKNKLFFSGKGEIGSIEFEVEGGINIQYENVRDNDIVQGLYELKFLLIFTKYSVLNNNILLYIKNDYPLIIAYDIPLMGELKLVLSHSKIL